MFITTTSVCNFFSKPPVSFITFYPKLADRYPRFVQSDGTIRGRDTMTSFDTSGEKRKHGDGDNTKVNHRVNNDSGGRGGSSNRGGNDGGGRGGNDGSNRGATPRWKRRWQSRGY